jgi:hypothetical protein
VGWNYDGVEPIEEQLAEYELLVAARQGEYAPPEHLAHRIHPVSLAKSYDEISSTALREKVRLGKTGASTPWRRSRIGCGSFTDKPYSPGGRASRNVFSLLAAAGMPQFAQGLGLDLPDPLARDGEVLPDLFEGVLAAILQAKAHLNDLLFPRAQTLQHLGGRVRADSD